MTEISIRTAAAWAAIGLCTAWPALSNAQTLTGQTVQGQVVLDGKVVYDVTGDQVQHQDTFKPNFQLYGDAATGQLALDASKTFIPEGSRYTEAKVTLLYHATVANTGPTAQAYDFNFSINKGGLGSTPGNYQLGPGAFDPASAGFFGVVLVNDKNVWMTVAGCQNVTCAYTGTDIGYVPSNSLINASYNFATYNGSVSLGLLNSGESVEVDYYLSSEVKGSGLAVASSRLGVSDLSALGGVGVSVSPVPEPETLVMLSMGLGLLALRTRRRG